MNLLACIVTSRVRAELFRLLFGLSSTELHVREIVKRAGLNIITVRRDLKKLLDMDLVRARKDGNRLYYRANTEHPLYVDIHNLVLKTSGLIEVLGRALGKEGIRVAFVFGSIAGGYVGARSDVDLIVIGDLGLRELAGRLSGVSDQIGREINPHAMTAVELRRRMGEGDHFVENLLRSPKLFVVGNEDELRGMGT
jgi:DNA-binding transcriptional ArsR family regulator